MKAVIEFDLPDDEKEHLLAVRGKDWALLAWRMRSFLWELPATDAEKKALEYMVNQMDLLNLTLDDLP